MATLLGRDTVDATTQLLNSADELIYSAAGYTATAGDVTSVRVRIDDWWTAGAFKVALYDASGNIVGSPVEFTTADGTGVVSKSFSTTVTATTYYPAIIVDSGYVQLRATDEAYRTDLNATGSYASPPTSVSVPGAGEGYYGYLDIWYDGTADGGASNTDRTPTVGAGALTGIASRMALGMRPLIGSGVIAGVAPRMALGMCPLIGSGALSGVAPRMNLGVTPLAARRVGT